jgi:CheY-like chemotaxis protein
LENEVCGNKPGILIVDDHRASRQFMAAALREKAGHVKTASTAAAGLAAALRWLPELILMDVRLGTANGYDVAREIRAAWPRSTRQPRIIMLSAVSRHPELFPATPGVTDDFLAKPFSATQLLDAVAPRPRPRPECEGFGKTAPPRLHSLFQSELATRLDLLDHCLVRLDLRGARAILHQLIASSGWCRQRRLERDLRALYAACEGRPRPAVLARQYFSLLVSAASYLQQARLAPLD